MDPSKRLSKHTHDFLKQELGNWENKNLITAEQRKKILEGYRAPSAVPRIQVFLSLGILLVAIGAVSFVASNWTFLPRLLQVSLLSASFLTADFMGLLLKEHYQKTSRALFYLGSALFGVTLFLVAGIYHVTLSPAWLMILWSIALAPKIFLFQELGDPLIATTVGIIGLTMLYDGRPWLGHHSLDGLIYILGFLPLVIREIQHPNRWTRAGLLATGFLWIGLELAAFELPRTTILLILLFGGLLLLSPWWKKKDPDFRFGWLVFGCTGWLLTFPTHWDWNWIQAPKIFAGVWAGVYVLLLLKSALRSQLIPLAFLYAVIFRYYVDTAFSYLPKSLFFIGAGILLIAFGFYFERIRRRKKEDSYEKF